MNEIVAGYGTGAKICKDPNRKLAYITKSIYITQLDFSSVNIINSSSYVEGSKVLGGALLAGGVGALIGASNSTELLIEINWRNGEKSIAQVKKDIFDLMIIGLNSYYTRDQIDSIAKAKDAKLQEEKSNDQLQLWGIALVWLLFIIFGTISGY